MVPDRSKTRPQEINSNVLIIFIVPCWPEKNTSDSRVVTRTPVLTHKIPLHHERVRCFKKQFHIILLNRTDLRLQYSVLEQEIPSRTACVWRQKIVLPIHLKQFGFIRV